ncbi:SDR family NAD(P)-dependent oxidoreductase [Sphingomonas sp. H39-1-10]|uniref:SDR family NAD(P)-dependent oxidoreductase n=1 Tax=Sphingomonas TaxID=13687 RepID=UPI00088686E2|nr:MULTISPECIES: SDR family NAD(P)-dependent oxidoreductase [Sphingomonas]MDF0488425.1 SDR family NAD(P)-dependent oxidoreductase [Sphingomonas pollutisoli]SDA10817.1 NADP-dependent 3-hydroxy acid dehydrogenase YdfG [Sphingomonas sp. NFR15]
MPTPSLPPAFSAGSTAVVTGAASGIGFAVAARLLGLGLKVALADLGGDRLDAAGRALGEAGEVLVVPTDVSSLEDVESLRDRVLAEWGFVSVLMNNAATGHNPGLPWENAAGWQALLDTNLMGVLHGVQAFVPAMLAQDRPGIVINTGSKQGITSPPDNYAYNLSKAGVRSYTESLSHALRDAAGDRVSAHLLIPGFTFTGMTGRAEKPAGAWSAEQVADFMFDRIAQGDFYILCPDNDVDRATDEKRMRWAMDDIIANRPALSRWHPDYAAAFATFMAE